MTTRLLTTTIVAILLAFGIYVCKYPPIKKNIPKNELCADYSNTQISELEVALVHDMSNNYKTEQLFVINKEIPSLNDARAVWFDFNKFEAFMYHMKNEARKNGITNTEKLGLRFYYASYPQITGLTSSRNDLRDVPLKYSKHHTLIAIPTLEIGGQVIDFNPKEIESYPTESELDSFPKITGTTTIGMLADKSNNSSNYTGARNHGSLYPPEPEVGLEF